MNVKKILYILIFSLFTSITAYQHNLSVCAIFQNEGRFLKEWLEFYILIGVDHFYLYNNYSTDNYKEILKPYIDAGIVDCTDWNYPFPLAESLAFDDCLNNVRDKTKWLMLIDLDEFFFPVQCDNLQEFLKDYEEFGAVSANWVMFGTSHVDKIPDDKLMIEMLTLSDVTIDKHVKSIIRPDRVKKFSIHNAEQFYPPYFSVTADKIRFEGPFMPSGNMNKLRVNHYWTRDNQYLHEIKIPRRYDYDKGSKEKILFYATIINQRKDLTIHKYLEPLKKRMFKK